MVEALKLIAIDPSIGGLLLVGEKGTAKSTAARAIAELLPSFQAYSCPYNCKPYDFLNLCQDCSSKKGSQEKRNPIVWKKPPLRTIPLGVTEERLLGGIDFEHTMREGRPVLRQGILGEANNGIVYIDEVNLLDPTLAHLMLDAVSSGRVRLEREGFSFSHPAKVALLGSMNPEEGPLGPQLADRFSLIVNLTGESDTEKRKEIILRRLAFEKNPEAFREEFYEESKKISQSIINAKKILPNLIISVKARIRAAELSSINKTQGHRADLALCLAARAKKALYEKHLSKISLTVGPEWVDSVEHLVIPARKRAESSSKIAKVIHEELIPYKGDEKQIGEKVFVPNAPEIPPDYKGEGFSPDDKSILHVFKTGEEYSVITPKAPREIGPKEQKGRRSFRETLKARGRAYKTTSRRMGRPLSLSATLRAAAPHQKERLKREEDSLNNLSKNPNNQKKTKNPKIPIPVKKVILTPADFREKVYRLKTGRLVIFVVDSSGSIGTLYRMEEAKAAAMSLLNDAYQKRDRVAIIAFYGTTAELLLPPTNSPDLAGRLLSSLPSGGKTPLAAALNLTHKLLKTERAKDPLVSPFVILMTDGRPNIPLDPKSEPWKEVLHFTDLLAEDPLLHFLLIDTDRGAYNEFKLTRELSEHLHCPKINLEELREGLLEKFLNHEL
jgi:magnesium chelatase subunit D